jgi:hypothetical protein
VKHAVQRGILGTNSANLIALNCLPYNHFARTEQKRISRNFCIVDIGGYLSVA